MLIAKLIRIPVTPILNIQSYFCTQPTPTSFALTTKANGFYRKTIRNTNISKQTQRGTFTEHALKRIIKLACHSDIQLIFQAYYNYMGHNTMISNTTVDDLILKAINLKKNPNTNLTLLSEKIIQLLKHHQYLRYYPHYGVTKECISFLSQKTDKLPVFIDILRDKILIKLDKETIEAMFANVNDWPNFTKFIKLAAYRSNRQLLHNLPKEDLLKLVGHKIQQFQPLNIMKQSREFQAFLLSFESNSIELALAWLICEGRLENAAQALAKISKQDPSIHTFVQAVVKMEEEGGNDNDIRGQLETYLQDTEHADLFR